MFRMFPTAHEHPQTHYYTPNVSSPLSSSPLRASPLSPRDSNLPTPTRASYSNYDQMMSPTPPPTIKSAKTPSTTSSRSATSSRESVFSKRTTKPNPLLHKGDEEGRETRRKLFLKKVKEGGEDKRWKARGGEEEMMRTIWVMEERRWVARQMEMFGGEEEEYLSLDEVMAEDVEVEEEKELEALLEFISEESSHGQRVPQTDEMRDSHWNGTSIPQPGVENSLLAAQETLETPCGSDDEYGIYDEIFMDVIQEEVRISSQVQQSQRPEVGGDEDMMDIS